MLRLRQTLHASFKLMCNNTDIVGYPLCFMYIFRSVVPPAKYLNEPYKYWCISVRLFLDYYQFPGGLTFYKDLIIQSCQGTREPLIMCSVYAYSIGTHIYKIPPELKVNKKKYKK